MSIDIQKKLKKAENKSFLARDFESLRQALIEQARIFFPDKIQDFSEPSIAGMLVDMAAYVGDSLAHYLDHEFRELDPALAVEPENIMMHIRNAGLVGYGASPASVRLKITIETPAETAPGGYRPKLSCLPILLQGTVINALTGIKFNTVEDLDFSELDLRGNLVASYAVKESDSSGVPKLYTVFRKVDAVSGTEAISTFSVPDTHIPFREFTLPDKDVSTVIVVSDSQGNEYYEVSALSQDTVFKKVQNFNSIDAERVSSNLEVAPAPYRFVKRYDNVTRRTTLRFGGGNADVLDDDIIPDPSELSLNLYGKKSFDRFSIDPNSLVGTQTLGISPKNTTLTVRYRHGGGLSHNVSSNAIKTITSLKLEFRASPIASEALSVRKSISAINDNSAGGAANPPTLEDLRTLLSTARQRQARIVTKKDVLARIYTLPTTFGKVYRAAIESNPVNPMSTILYICSLDKGGKITVSPDSLKKNISTYLNEYRLIADAFDVLDARIVNFGVKYSVVLRQDANKTQVVQNINLKIADAFNRKYFQISQPIIIDDVTNLIINTVSVIALIDLQVHPKTAGDGSREYSSSTFDFKNSQKRGIIFCPIGSIFELRYSDQDIVGSAM